MPKPKLPPQGGEKWLCLGMFLTIMFSVVMVVTIIYSTVIIYNPSYEELSKNIVGPKRCTTTLVQRNITGTFYSFKGIVKFLDHGRNVASFVVFSQ